MIAFDINNKFMIVYFVSLIICFLGILKSFDRPNVLASIFALVTAFLCLIPVINTALATMHTLIYLWTVFFDKQVLLNKEVSYRKQINTEENT